VQKLIVYIIVTDNMINIEKFKKVRQWLWFTQGELADKIWMNILTVQRIEAGANTKAWTIKKIVDVFNCGRTNWPFVCKSIYKYEVIYFLTK